MKLHNIRPLVLITVAALASCAVVPERNSLLDQARADYGSAQANSQVTSLAAGELKQAGDSLDKANVASSKGEDRVIVDHLAYVAKQQVAIAREAAAQRAAELAIANAGAERDRVRLQARTREADMAQRSAEESQRQVVTARQAAYDAQQNAQSARLQTQDAENRTRVLEAQLREMDARKTDRGTVITLGDVLFDTNASQLKSGGVRNVQKLADFFKQYPQRTALIEGFTDSTGGANHNLELSMERAGAVRTALLGMGIGTDRLTSRGYGESYPVASNETVAGRQLNRRVEIVVSDDNGKIAPR